MPAGIDSNIGIPYYPVGGQDTDTYSRTDTITNYMVDQTERRTVQAPGRITRLSTAVIINGMPNAEQIDRIRAIVETAVGFDPLRGDQITVEGMFFDEGPVLEPVPDDVEEPAPEPRPWWHWVLMGVGALILMAVMVILARRRRAARVEEEVPAPPVEQIPTPKVVPELTLEEKVRVEKQKKITDIIREKPEDAVLLLRAWLSEE